MRDDFRFHLVMASAGFLCGLVLVVPAALWLAGKPSPGPVRPARQAGAFPEAMSSAKAGASSPALVSAPIRTGRTPATADPADPAESDAARPEAGKPEASENHAIAAARELIRVGDIPSARRLLAVPEFAENGIALFMLAETYDPTVLAAMGMHGLLAEAPTARRYYELAREHGMTAADRRIEQLRP